jgi:hypothetical protein
MSERSACRPVGQHRSMQRYRSQKDCDDKLIAKIKKKQPLKKDVLATEESMLS